MIEPLSLTDKMFRVQDFGR